MSSSRYKRVSDGVSARYAVDTSVSDGVSACYAVDTSVCLMVSLLVMQ